MCKISHIKHGLIAKKGRIQIELTIHRFGSDAIALLSGGAAHIGAIAMAAPGQSCATLETPQHREGPLAAQIANILASRLGGNIAVICGIHYNAIRRAEIDDILDLAPRLAMELGRNISAMPGLCRRSRSGPLRRPGRNRARRASRSWPVYSRFNPEAINAENGTTGTNPEVS